MPETSPEQRQGLADDFLDLLLPERLEWRRLVATYPRISLLVAGVAGFLVARKQGPAIVGAVSSRAQKEVAGGIEAFLGESLAED
jgi:hypothetical protein